MPTTKTHTLLDPTTVRTLESSSWGAGYRGVKVARAVEATAAVGIPWPTTTVEGIEQLAPALARVTTLTTTRPRLTLEDLLADDAPERTRAAIAIDEGGTRRGTSAQAELRQVAILELNRLITDAAPTVLDTVADWLLEHQDERHLARLARDLPPHQRDTLTRWNSAIDAHAELLRITDPLGFEDLERNEEAHRLHAWTSEQWLALHAEQDTLTTTSTTARWWEWPDLPHVAIDPARTTAQLHQRAHEFNNLAEAWNSEHRAKRKA